MVPITEVTGMRRSSLAFLAVCTVATVATGVFLAWIVLGWPLENAVDDLGELVAAWLAAAACGAAAWRHRGRARVAWGLMSASAFTWGAGEAVWSWYELHLGQAVPFPSLADAGYLGAVPLAAAAALTFPGLRREHRAQLCGALDGLVIACGLLAVSWVTVLHTVESAGSDGLLAQVLSIAYPAGDVLIATMLLTLVIRLPQGSRLPVLLVVAGLAGNAVADSAFAYLTAAGTYAAGNAIDTGWFAGYLLLACGAVRAAQRPVSMRGETRTTTWWRLLLPYLPLGAALAGAAREVLDGGLEPFLFWLLAAMTVLVAARQLVTLSDNRALLRHLGTREAEMRHRAFHDPLTDLPNRALIRRRAELALEPVDVAPDAQVCVMVIDLDDFKYVNDAMGHEAGDRLLVEVAERLRGCVRATDTAARLGGDEFAVLMTRVDGPWHARGIAERVVTALREEVDLGTQAVAVPVSVGLALGRPGEVAYDELLRRADVAMYRAKGEGKARYLAYDPAFEADVVSPRVRLAG